MSRRSSRTPRKTGSAQVKAIDRPFDESILETAQRLAGKYRLILEPDADVGYLGHALELPMVMADGKTPDACVSSLREALVAAVATMLELGQRPPTPAARSQRTAQINVRVSEEEKLMLEDAARRSGFRGVSDFVRSTALSHTK